MVRSSTATARTEKEPKEPSARMQRRRAHLVAVAEKVIRERGFDAVSVDELAAVASISVGGLYRYIKSKKDLLEMICDEINDGVVEEMVAAAAEQSTHADKLSAAFSVYWDRSWKFSSSLMVAYREFIHFSDHAKQRHTKEQTDTANVFAQLIRAGIADGAFADVDAYALSYQMLLLSHIRVLKGWALHGYGKDRLMRENIEFVLARLDAGPTPRSAKRTHFVKKSGAVCPSPGRKITVRSGDAR